MAMTNRIYFSAWGFRGSILHRSPDLPAYAMADLDDIESRADRVAGAIARKNGLEVITVSSDGTALDNSGQPESRHYQATLGHAYRSGGWSPELEFWFSIPCGSATEPRDL